MRLLGTIVRLQVQVESLKIGTPPQKRYDPSGIRSVERLGISADGVEGLSIDGSLLADIHNAKHAHSKNRAGSNGISFCFTSHYDLMRRRFGEHLTDGIAGENILVERHNSGEIFTEDAFERGVLIQGGEDQPVNLKDVIVAAPCVEFSRWALRFPDDARRDRTVTETVQFMNEGTRGFYCSFGGGGAILHIGDRVFAL